MGRSFPSVAIITGKDCVKFGDRRAGYYPFVKIVDRNFILLTLVTCFCYQRYTEMKRSALLVILVWAILKTTSIYSNLVTRKLETFIFKNLRVSDKCNKFMLVSLPKLR